MAGISFPELHFPPPDGRGGLYSVRRVCGAVLPRSGPGWSILAAPVRVLSAPVQARARRNAWQAWQELAEVRQAAQRRRTPPPAAWSGDPEHLDAPELLRSAGR